MNLNKSIKIFLNYVLGPALFLWVSVSIYHQLKDQKDLPQALEQIKHSLSGGHLWKLVLVILLMFLNWGIEARKWQLLVRPLQPISFLRAFYSVLSGVSFAINTPNRIGEYGGRVLYMKEGNRAKAISLAILGSASQLIITLVLGIGGLLYLKNLNIFSTTTSGNTLSILWFSILLYGALLATIVTLIFYFRLSGIVKWMEGISGMAKWVSYIRALNKFDTSYLLHILFLSFVRYLVFANQYLLLMDVFGVEIYWWQGFWVISVLFLILSVVPTFALSELGIRGKVFIFLLDSFSKNYVGIISCTVGIWILNLVIPALIGSLLILGIKMFSRR
ncbi:MAG TPA: lysylphosphatidylglycerol synthase domain-containing protein [Chitinophagaceae bacterium]|nr:lysylphosphatidylglycerol synthase domain-containing protein [Chitinophagaceae bacterium]